MVFTIRKNATLPILKLKVYKDGRNDFYKLMDLLPTASITFAMKDNITGIYKVANRSAQIYLKDPSVTDGVKEYYIGYQFTSEDTDTPGVYTGSFKINCFNSDNSLYGELVVPIREELYIYVIDNFVKSDVVYI
jgi:hypothetical protein